MRNLFIFFFFILLIAKGISQCLSTSPRSASVFSNSVGIGTIAWITPSNTAASDNIRTIAGSIIGILGSSSANWSTQSGFGFSVPPSAVICGIQVDIEKRQQGVIIGSTVKDNSVKILKAGALTGSEHASAAAWPSTDTYISYGGPTDTWGTTWTPADINAMDFGVAYSASLNAGLVSLFLTAEVDHVKITVFYDLVLPIKVSAFSAECASENVQLKWKAADQANTNYFTIERSEDGISFNQAGIVALENRTNSELDYSFTDASPKNGTSYYRLKETNLSGGINYFPVISSECKKTTGQLFYPNPSEGKFTINSTGNIVIYNLKGETIYSQTLSEQTEIDLSVQPKGIYFYQLVNDKKVSYTGKIIIQ